MSVPMVKKQVRSFGVGAVVRITGGACKGMTGVVKAIVDADKQYIGVELDEHHQTGHTGKFAKNGSQPFQCENGKGKYVTASFLEPLEPAEAALRKGPESKPAAPKGGGGGHGIEEDHRRCDEMNKIFDYFDANHDGKVDAEEFHTFARQVDAMYDCEGGTKMFKLMDINHDGVLDEDEFRTYMLKVTQKASAAQFDKFVEKYHTAYAALARKREAEQTARRQSAKSAQEKIPEIQDTLRRICADAIPPGATFEQMNPSSVAQQIGSAAFDYLRQEDFLQKHKIWVNTMVVNLNGYVEYRNVLWTSTDKDLSIAW